jgi:hypothetical protein
LHSHHTKRAQIGNVTTANIDWPQSFNPHINSSGSQLHLPCCAAAPVSVPRHIYCIPFESVLHMRYQLA